MKYLLALGFLGVASAHSIIGSQNGYNGAGLFTLNSALVTAACTDPDAPACVEPCADACFSRYVQQNSIELDSVGVIISNSNGECYCTTTLIAPGVTPTSTSSHTQTDVSKPAPPPATGDITDCKDTTACNANPDADIADDSLCNYPQQNYNCEGVCTANTDCAGTCGGDDSTCADACGVPNGDGSSCADACGVPNGSNQPGIGKYCDGNGESPITTCDSAEGLQEDQAPTATSDRTCKPILCGENEKVVGHQCQPCGQGFTSDADAYASGGDTQCLCAAGKGVHDGICRDCVNKEANADTTVDAPCVDQTCPAGFGVVADGFDNALEHDNLDNCENCIDIYGPLYISPGVSGVCQLDTDQDGDPDATDPDDDGDGVADASDAFPKDPSESVDTDSDGTGNNADSDDDGDGVLDVDDAFPLDSTESVDTDNDGIGDNADTDDDNDGVLDVDEADGCSLIADCDGDAVGDAQDAFPKDSTESVDTDGDGTGDNADTDDDGDGVADASDAFPFDVSKACKSDDKTGETVFAADKTKVLVCSGSYVGGGKATCTNGAIVKSWECTLKTDLSDPAKKDNAIDKIKDGIMKPGKKTSYADDAVKEEARKAAKSARRDQMKAAVTAGLSWEDLVVEDTNFEGFTDKVIGALGANGKAKYRLVVGSNQMFEITPGDKLGEAPAGNLDFFDLDDDASITLTVTGESHQVFAVKSSGELTVNCNSDEVSGTDGEFLCGGRKWYISSLASGSDCVANAELVDHDNDTNTQDICACVIGFAGSPFGSPTQCLVDTDGDGKADVDDTDDDNDGVTDLREEADGTDPLVVNDFNECSRLEEAGVAQAYIDGQCCKCE